MNHTDRMMENLFHGSGQETFNVKFFLGDKRATAEEVAEQVNAVFAQERTGVTIKTDSLDDDLKETNVADFLNALK